MTIRQALAEGNCALKTGGIENPALDASLFLAKVLGTERTSLYTNACRTLCETELASFRSLLERRLKGECAAYILGKKEFRALEFLVNQSVLVPRPDTEILVEVALEKLAAGKGRKALDLCTGSGAIAVSLKHEMPELEVWAADICPEALQTAKANAACLLGEGSIYFFHGDLYKALPASLCPFRHQFHLIVSNPPYIASEKLKNLPIEVQKEPRIALDGGKDGLFIIKNIIAEAKYHLYPQGTLLLEADPWQMKKISALLEQNGFFDIKIFNDLSGRQRVIAGTTVGEKQL